MRTGRAAALVTRLEWRACSLRSRCSTRARSRLKPRPNPSARSAICRQHRSKACAKPTESSCRVRAHTLRAQVAPDTCMAAPDSAHGQTAHDAGEQPRSRPLREPACCAPVGLVGGLLFYTHPCFLPLQTADFVVVVVAAAQAACVRHRHWCEGRRQHFRRGCAFAPRKSRRKLPGSTEKMVEASNPASRRREKPSARCGVDGRRF